ncbi:MAG: ISNCY family transposase [Candidatus Omnitrophota bacterium]|nr:ISNCY family transposase [Candidatus Omnitrophota bacterium]
MSQQELQRVPVFEAVRTHQLRQVEAARHLGLSTRQVRRLQHRFAQEGPSGLAHRARGRPSNARTPAVRRAQALALIRARYPDFGPTLAGEMLRAHHRLSVSDETLRQWMRAEGLWAGRRRARPHRQWRERAACGGQMVQMDGSHHAWLEGRGPRLVLMGYIDDATGTVWARLYPSEDLPAAFDSVRRYCQHYGMPQAVYLDKHTIYRSPKTPTVEDQLRGTWPQSQFERALAQLGIRVIHANSPQAKGRVERLFGTLQDRLVKALRLAHCTTLAEANRVLPRFLAAYNRRFAHPPRQPGNLHRPVPAGLRLESILCVHQPRVVANDGTVQLNGHRLQLVPSTRRSLAQRRVTVTQRATGQLQVLCEGTVVPHRALPIVPPRPARPVRPRSRYVPRRAHRPAADHPWRLTTPKNRTFLFGTKADISILA